MSAAESLSMPRVAGLMASVGRDCHFERTGMRQTNLSEQTAASLVIRAMAPMIDAYLEHLRVERRLADAHARELRARSGGAGRASRGAGARRSTRSTARRSKRSSASR